jgi:DNA-binding CsgD family transcriptional regulator
MAEPNEKHFAGFITQIYQAPLEPGGWDKFLIDFAGLFSSSGGIIAQSANGAAGISIPVGIGADAMFSYEKYYSGKKPWLRTLRDFQPLEVFGLETLTSEPEYRASEYYNDWLRPQDKYHLIGGSIECRGAISMILTLMRSEKLGDYTARERELYRQLLPHLRQALLVHHRLVGADLRQQGLLTALDNLALGLIICRADASVVLANATAEAILRRNQGLGVDQGKLRAARQRNTNTLRALIWSATESGAAGRNRQGGMMRLPQPEAPPLSVLISPLPELGLPALGVGADDALVFVSDPMISPRYRVSDLRQLYGLSIAEGALLAALLSGATLQSYADEAAITLNTAKTHLRHIFEKTGQHRQADLIRAVLTNPILRLAAD